MSNENKWQQEALADAARFAAKRQPVLNVPTPGPLADDEDVIQEGEHCSECDWALQGGTVYCANCGFCFYEDEEAETGMPAVEDSGPPTASITAEDTCSVCAWGLQDESTFCGNCGRRLREDEALPATSFSGSSLSGSTTSDAAAGSDGSLFGWLRRKK